SAALDNFARSSERARAEQKIRQERDFSEAILDSLPGVFYFYTATGQFLRWNANFASVTGYTAEELAGRRPTDFIAAPDRERVAARIADVFEHGQSCVEAGLLTKDGTVIPYYFTGVRTLSAGKPCLMGVGIDIRDRTRAEAALRESEQRYRSTLDHMMEGCQLLDFNWRYLYLNGIAALHNRRQNSELIGRSFLEMWPGIEQTPAFALLQRSMEERIALHEEIHFTYPGGDHAWFDVRVQPVPEGIFVLSIDISERKRAEAALAETKTILENVVDNLTEGLVISDPAGTFFRWNTAALRMLGFDDTNEGRRREPEFHQLFDLAGIDGSSLPPDAWPLARARRGEVFRGYEVRIRRRDSDWERVFSYSGASVRYEGSRLLAVVTMGDITERFAADRRLREAHDRLEHKVAARTEELRAAVARAEASDQIKSAFLATMSHELRTPLNSIIGFTGIILQELAGPLNPEQKKQLGMVRGSARHLLELINDVLDISKIEAGQLQVQAEAFLLPDSIERVLATVRPAAAKKPIELRHRVDPALGEMHSDRRRIEQILLNLLSNAIKFTEHGAVTLEASLVPDFRRTPDEPPSSAVRLCVTDTGIGIKAGDLGKLFQPFRQIDSGLARSHDGTGLGLAICRRLAVLLGGTISVASEWGRGSVFTAVLPLRKPASP
ncbi:MAG TPA: PAS domain S-box protein, partial [Opitutaceae bacterium]